MESGITREGEDEGCIVKPDTKTEEAWVPTGPSFLETMPDDVLFAIFDFMVGNEHHGRLPSIIPNAQLEQPTLQQQMRFAT